jgi:hypothetical protein
VEKYSNSLEVEAINNSKTAKIKSKQIKGNNKF